MDSDNNKLKLLYKTILGRVLLKLIFCRRWFSKMASIYYNSSLSKIEGYHSYNDWFTRKKTVNICGSEIDLISVAEANLSVIREEGNSFIVKNSVYDLEELVNDKKLAEEFKDGIILIFRLEYNYYHRYIFIDDGRLVFSKEINGELHTVRPIASKYKVYKRNTRIVNLLKTDNFGDVLQIEVGALLVGRIENNNKIKFKRGEEKGHFELGGSTIIQVYKKNVIEIEEHIEEIKVDIGEKIGEKNVKKN